MNVLLLLIAHLLGDFIFQTSHLAYQKTRKMSYFFLHCLLYAVAIFIPMLIMAPIKEVFIGFGVIIGSHGLIDYYRICKANKLEKKIKNSNTSTCKIRKKTVRQRQNVFKEGINTKDNQKRASTADFFSFIWDQIFHVGIILIVCIFVNDFNGIGKNFIGFWEQYISFTTMHNLLLIIFLYLCCLNPAAIFIKKAFDHFFRMEEASLHNQTDIINSGLLIGILERIILLTLGLTGQIGAIGFVLAAKSLARFKQLEDKNFAEKYLVGTLLSTSIALFLVTIGKILWLK